MKVVIFGATGTVGHQVVEQALAQGHEVTAFSRHPEKLEIPQKNLQLFAGDVMDSSTVEKAIAGQDAVVCVLGSGKKLSGHVRSEGTRNIIQAMEKTGVRRLICQSTLGAGESWNNLDFYWKYVMFGFILRKVFADHLVQEELVAQSQLDWTIVRPSAFIDGDRTGNYRHGFPTDDRTITLKISTADVADFLLQQLTNSLYIGKTPGLSY
ncbi:NAD-dependent epimerase/dehydratase [[Leptolyngbya] sp. PCC 7376]|uniref:NAD(P)-dependent oxidoreductase n=1 Tax=[Leptolyngbya] sp. PCC 7376 TaxID=111781 RepID=UPI00029EEA72|nr:SDR family oxidoreductase [[Leptolyngbya] sp. PCC 7376]AFY36890.1 NAD-dependent epimerase/dehydratase [[Leptolyngbya] sp. PCC 7376]